MTRPEQPRFRRIWRYVRLGLLVILTLMLIMQLVSQDWGTVVPTAVFIALLAFLDAVDRGWLRRFSSGQPPGSR